jgi:predicted SAM-dependent methyltransferase
MIRISGFDTILQNGKIMERLVLPCLLILAIAAGYGVAEAAKQVRSRSITAVNVWRRKGIISRYLASRQIRKLQLRAGGLNLSGWLNTDIDPEPDQAYLDATRPFPLPDQSVHYVFAEHVIEHLSYEDGLGAFRECYRVLVPGGKIRFATPDLRRFAALLDQAQASYIDVKFQEWPSRPAPLCPAFIINEEMREFGHRFLYDEVTLRDSLAHSGFKSIQRFAPGTSDDENLAGVEGRHNDLRVRPVNDYETMVLQATR